MTVHNYNLSSCPSIGAIPSWNQTLLVNPLSTTIFEQQPIAYFDSGIRIGPNVFSGTITETTIGGGPYLTYSNSDSGHFLIGAQVWTDEALGLSSDGLTEFWDIEYSGGGSIQIVGRAGGVPGSVLNWNQSTVDILAWSQGTGRDLSWTLSGILLTTDRQIISTYPSSSGPPFVVSSVTLVPNLNVGYLGGIAPIGYGQIGANNVWSGTNEFDNTVYLNLANTAAFKVGSGPDFQIDTVNHTISIGNTNTPSATTLINVVATASLFTRLLDFTRTITTKLNPVNSLVMSDTLSWTGAPNLNHSLVGLTLVDNTICNTGTGGHTLNGLGLTVSNNCNNSVGSTANVRGFTKTVSDAGTYSRSAGNTTASCYSDLLTYSAGPTYNDGGGTTRTLNYSGGCTSAGISFGGTLTSGILNATIDGSNIGVSNNSLTVTAGTFNLIYRGYYWGGAGQSTSVTSSSFAFLNEFTGADNNYGYFNNTASHSYMGLDNSKSFWGTNTNSGTASPTNQLTTGDASIYYDGTDFIFNPKEVGTGTAKFLGNITLNTFNLITDTSTGSQIATGSTQKLGFWGHTPAARPSAYTVTNTTTNRSLDETGATLAQVAQVLGTLIQDLQGIGMVG